MPAAPRPPLLQRVPSRVRTGVAWSGAVAFPLLVAGVVMLEPRPPVVGVPLVLPLLVMTAPLGLLRRRPLTTLGLLLASVVFVSLAGDPGNGGYLWDVRNIQIVVIDLAVGLIAAGNRRQVSVTALVVALMIQLGCVLLYDPGFFFPGSGPHLPTAAVIVPLLLVVAWQVGNSIRQRRVHAEARRTQAAVQAVQAERLRIARELHDMIAHSIGVIAIQAGMGSRVIDTQPAEARNALSVIEDTSRETLAGLRRMLGALRRADQQGLGGPASPPSPSPCLAELDKLVARSQDAGVRVDVRRLGRERVLPADIELSAFRVIQESVTNVVRHADAGECRVSLDYGDDGLSIEILDEGRGGVPGDGYGIPGMRERISLLHGDFAAGPRAEGGFRVSARIPLPPGVR